jgi:hypothetical protein
MGPEQFRALGMKEIGGALGRSARTIGGESWWSRYGVPIGAGLGGIGAGLGVAALIDLLSKSRGSQY